MIDLTCGPDVSRVLDALWDLGVRGQAVAKDVLDAVNGAGLNDVQTTAVLAAFGRSAPTELDDDAVVWDTYPDGDGDGLPRQRATQ